MGSESTVRAQPTSVSLVGFELPVWHGVFDVEAQLAQVPPEATVKGMFWNDLCKLAEAAAVALPVTRYAAFADYPLIEYMRAVALVGRAAYPKSSTADGIRRVGERGFGILASSLAGKVLFALAGRDLQSTLGLVSQAYRRCLNPGDAQVPLLESKRAVIALRSIWNFPTAYQVGVFEGALRNFGHSGSVKVRSLSACDADYLIEWR
jgi:uncharacterized protein (TIGR02265 family)